MRIEKIKLENFRNIASLEMTPTEGVNVIYGDNAQGKTNLVEAVWLFTGARSFRGGKERELIRFDCEQARAQVEFFCGGRLQSAGLILVNSVNGETSQGGKKAAFLNEISLENASRLAGRFYAVVFSPSHLSLVRDGPAERRKFLDTAISQIVPKYDSYLKEYNRALLQRNALLKDLARFPQLYDTAEIWEEHLAKIAAAIVLYRSRYCRKLAPLAAATYSGIAGGKEQFTLEYCASGITGMEGRLTDTSRDEIRLALQKKLKDTRKGDMDRGATSVGPHRDDLDLSVNGLPMRLYGSQGQQRSGVLALKMAECGMIEDAVGETPVVLLDDVMSELDAGRRDYLLNHMEGRQVFVTCCDGQSFQGMLRGKQFYMRNGALKESGTDGE